ncbi:protein FAM83H isoform X2 [Synchiropus splendidus]|uniref:protein FAM83H isoform X2 n=1 Tax=Synchiropus splendidus TaxID=270530 RepID=UPI00237DF283|nr:protein FAM83H isoform X2 [Synchiropus splendidus]
MARRSQCSSAGDNPLHPNYLPPHYREEYRLAIDALVEADLDGYYEFLQRADVVDFLSPPEIDYIQGSVQLPQQSSNPDHPYLESDGEGSSDTYWPVHSDLEVPGLDLGWPQFHHSSLPTEVTTLVNPPEPDMPSIKEQARRLIKNAQQVIGIVMDMFTDVDIFADILNAAMRNVAVYIILDEQNANHFTHMVNNCRVNLHAIQFLRVRVVSGITYHCRSGKSFKGQMMDRFLLTDCRAVLSGNYSFMWSFEKLHRCMAHLFLGQLVSTFDEEFRILFAQSQPLLIDNVPPQMEEFGLLPKRSYPNIRTSLHRDPRRFLSMDVPGQDEWVRHPYEDRMDGDWRVTQLKRQETVPGPVDMYSKFSPQQSRIEMHYDQGHSRMPKMDNAAFKRHSYAEGGHGRYSLPFMQAPAPPDLDVPGRQLHRGSQLNIGPEAEYSGHEKFWNQDYHPIEPYSERCYLPDLGPADAYDPVANYLASTRTRDFDQGPDRLQIPGDLPLSNRRLSGGQVYPSQISPTPSNTVEEKPFLQESNVDRKDPMVKKGLRNWRLNSYLSAYDNPVDEGPSLTPPLAQDPFEEPPHPVELKPQAVEFSIPKIPNVREFRVPAIPRASQIPSYAKTALSDQTKRQTEENTQVPAVTKTSEPINPAAQTETRTQSPLTLSETKTPGEAKTTPCPSESSSTTTDGDKPEELEPKEPISGLLRREESFRRKYNPGIQRSSRLRSSLIFSSLEQHTDSKTSSEQQDEESDKKETELAKLPYVSQVWSQKRTAREPFKWTPNVASTTSDSSTTKADKTDGEESKEENSKEDAQKSNDPASKETDAELKDPPEVSGPKPSKASELPSMSFLNSSPFLDMNDPDQRLMFFKELAAKRKAAKAMEAEKSSEKATKEPEIKNVVEPQKAASSVQKVGLVNSSESTEAFPKEAVKVDLQVDTTQSCENVSTDSEKMKQKISQLAAAVHISEDMQSHDSQELPKLAVKDVTAEAALKTPEKLDVVPSPVLSTDERNTLTQESDAPVDMPSSSSISIHNIDDSQTNKSDTLPTASTLLAESATEKENTSELTVSTETPSTDSKQPPSCTLSTSSAPAEDQNTSKDVPAPHAPQVELYISEEPYPAPSIQPSEGTAERPSDIDSTPASIDTVSEATSAVDPDISLNQSSPLPNVNIDSTALLSTDSPAPESNSDEAPCSQEPVEEVETDDVTPASDDTVANVPPVESDSVTPAMKEHVSPTPSPAGVLTDTLTPSLQDSQQQEAPQCEPDPTDLGADELEVEDSAESGSSTTQASTEIQTLTETGGPTTALTPISTENGLEPESECLEKNTVSPPQPADDVDLAAQSEVEKELPETADDKVAVEESAEETISIEKANDQDDQSKSEKTDVKMDEGPPPSSLPKQPKSRYHSSTANVISSSNLRDDTKLLLEQISAHSQSRNEMSKEAPVTDDEKEDEADKMANVGVKPNGKGRQKTPQERQVLLEKIQSMRKERKVYSRFELFVRHTES